MTNPKDKNFSERLQRAAEAKQAMLGRFKARPAEDDPSVAARRAEREAISAAREVRSAERKAAEDAMAERRAIEAAETERQAEIARTRAVEEEGERAAQQKAARDARYAARKARK
ncbi:MAG TPA: DUF6481 family protein [Salinarimonas sp.]|nr:DUF6481 family protein [Salinarimonas sp.]